MDDIQSGLIKAAVRLFIFAESMAFIFYAEHILRGTEAGLARLFAEGVFYG